MLGQWRDIRTAPRGRAESGAPREPILLWGPRETSPVQGRWRDEIPDPGGLEPTMEAVWYDMAGLPVEATHWMPLPAPPDDGSDFATFVDIMVGAG